MRIPEHRLLRKAVTKVVQRTGQFPLEQYFDDHGRFGLRYKNFILAAKESLYGNILSCHRKLVFEGILHRIPILIWLDDAKKFYAFNPEEIEKYSEENMKGKSIMCNFEISMGKGVKL